VLLVLLRLGRTSDHIHSSDLIVHLDRWHWSGFSRHRCAPLKTHALLINCVLVRAALVDLGQFQQWKNWTTSIPTTHPHLARGELRGIRFGLDLPARRTLKRPANSTHSGSVQYGETAFSEIRRFVVVRNKGNSVSACTYIIRNFRNILTDSLVRDNRIEVAAPRNPV